MIDLSIYAEMVNSMQIVGGISCAKLINSNYEQVCEKFSSRKKWNDTK